MEPKLIKGIKSFSDERGMFYESYKQSRYRDVFEINEKFVQDNHSISTKNTIRGLHYQWNEPMGKLVRVCYGSILDVAVDVRFGSKTYGKTHYFKLDDENLDQAYIPPGFAHGFICLSDKAHVLYKCTSEYNKDGESGINPFDATLGVDWGISKQEAIFSEKDANAQSFEEYSREAKFVL